MPQPQFPLISVGHDGILDVIINDAVFSKASARNLLDTALSNEIELFDSEFNKWKYQLIAEHLKDNWLTRLLAKTVYNPSFDTKIVWSFAGAYQTNELKEKIKECVDKDDDIITQFEEGAIIKTAIDKATGFDGILIVLNKYVFTVDEENLWNEQEARGE